MRIGTQDFKENDYIGLVLDDEEEEEENFNNEIRNDQGVVIPKEGAQLEENIMNNNMNNPEEFHNMVQQQMGKPIITQNMFENIDDNNNKGENEFINPAMASMQVEDDINIGGLGGSLRKTSLQPNMQNMNMINPNNINNMKKTNTQLNDMRKTAIGGKFSLSNFLIFYII